MKFSTRVDVEAPPDTAFAAFSDFPRFVRRAEKRGAKVDVVAARVFAWRVRFDWNGATRDLAGDVTRFDPPRGFEAVMTSGGLEGRLEVEVTPLDPGRSRVRVSMEWRPTTLASRMLVQSLKLVKGRLDDHFATRVAEYAAGIGRSA